MHNEIKWQKCLRCDAAKYRKCDCPRPAMKYCPHAELSFCDARWECKAKRKICTAIICHLPTQVCVDISELEGITP